MMVSMPTQGDISQLLGLIDLVKLALDADKARAVIEQLSAVPGRHGFSAYTMGEATGSEAKAVQDAAERIDEAKRADLMVEEAQKKADELKAAAQAERDEAASHLSAAKHRAERAAQAEIAAQAALDQAGKILEQARADAAGIVAEAQSINDKANETLEQAVAKRAEYEGKLEQLRAVAGA